MNYRPEIDGLRSIAVLPVIFFHAGYPLFSGGFVGVDVFFVISGYLISTLIFQEIEQEKFSLVSFYERRARRILPALFVVMLVSSLFAIWLFHPLHLLDFGKSLISVPLFISNILFWLQSGYFGIETAITPLIHTWSLAVEEQFYIVFPLLLLFCWKFGLSRVTTVLVIIAILSLLASQWAVMQFPEAGFYLIFFRFWELLAGVFAAIWLRKNSIKSTLVADFISLIGIFLIAFSIFTFDKNTPFPGISSLFPVVGTTLIILNSNAASLINRCLSIKVSNFFGAFKLFRLSLASAYFCVLPY